MGIIQSLCNTNLFLQTQLCGSSVRTSKILITLHAPTCSWRLIEAAQGISNALPNDRSVLGGENEATYLAKQAKAQGFTVMRMFGIADVNWNEGSPLQPSPGAHFSQSCCRSFLACKC